MDETAIRPARQRNDVAAIARGFTPKLIITLREGYSFGRLGQDAVAGLTVAILALPLSMAIAIGAGLPPETGLITTIVAGFLISALGGSRHQIGGPAAAFIVVIVGIVDKHGQAGLLTATFLAGLLLIIAAFLKLGTYVKYVPGPVILGFTSGVGALVMLGQIKDMLGLRGVVPADTAHRIAALWNLKGTFNPSAFAVGIATLAMIILLKRFAPRWPGLLIAVVGASAAVALLGLPVETIGSRFGGIGISLPTPRLPDLSWHMFEAVVPSALTLAFLIGVESLLSAVAADTITGCRHHSNTEILAQGVANAASPLFGGLPATGVLARTATNISAGGQTPVSGLLHAVFVLIAMVALGPLAAHMALPCLAAVLLNVAWRLLDVGELWSFLRRAPRDDVVVLLATLLLTIFISLDVAIAVGVAMASLLFVHRMADGNDATASDASSTDALDILPKGVRLFRFSGPLFYGVSDNISLALADAEPWPSVVILDLVDVQLIDATAMAALEELAGLCAKRGTRIVMASPKGQPHRAFAAYGTVRQHAIVAAQSRQEAIEKARLLQDEKS